jgi:hypothetical protein
MSGPLCVIRDKHFSETAKRLNLSEDALERIVHEYINEVENAEAFPSDSYIRAKYEVTNVVKTDEIEYLTTIWEHSFSTPVIVDTLEEAVLLRDKAKQFFKSEAVTVKPLNNNTFQIIVAKPTKPTMKATAAKGPIVYNKEQLKANILESQKLIINENSELI